MYHTSVYVSYISIIMPLTSRDKHTVVDCGGVILGRDTPKNKEKEKGVEEEEMCIRTTMVCSYLQQGCQLYVLQWEA